MRPQLNSNKLLASVSPSVLTIGVVGVIQVEGATGVDVVVIVAYDFAVVVDDVEILSWSVVTIEIPRYLQGTLIEIREESKKARTHIQSFVRTIFAHILNSSMDGPPIPRDGNAAVAVFTRLRAKQVTTDSNDQVARFGHVSTCRQSAVIMIPGGHDIFVNISST